MGEAEIPVRITAGSWHRRRGTSTLRSQCRRVSEMLQKVWSWLRGQPLGKCLKACLTNEVTSQFGAAACF